MRYRQVSQECFEGSEFFPLREVPLMKRDAIDENYSSLQWYPFDVRSYNNILASLMVTLLKKQLLTKVYIHLRSSVI